jgi:prepilin-type N-terminal cleavage/methylation domain-containing protein
MHEATNARRGERGYNLIEVLIATAILGTVIMSIMTLFVLGQKNVYSGKQMTRATSAATHVLEDLNAMTTDDLWAAFAITPTTALTSPTIADVKYTDVIVRKTNPIANDTGGYLARWAALMGDEQIKDGSVTLILIPSDLATAGDPTTARFVRVRVVTQWSEAARKRNVTVDTTKINRI